MKKLNSKTRLLVGISVIVCFALTSSFIYAAPSSPPPGGNVDANFSSITSGTGSITGNLKVDTDTLYVDTTTKKVGIGTTEPHAKLNIELPTPYTGGLIEAGYSSDAFGNYSVAIGYDTAAASYGTAIGYKAAAIDNYGTALGSNTKAKLGATAMGNWTEAFGDVSTAMGNRTHASGFVSTAMGYNTTASGDTSTAMGFGTTASGVKSTALGTGTTASGGWSTAMGLNTIASNDYSTAIGNESRASGYSSTAIGEGSKAKGKFSIAMGNGSTANGENSTAMGAATTANGLYSTAMGYWTEANGDWTTAMGLGTKATSNYATSMGYHTTAGDNTANGAEAATALGMETTASGYTSTAMGRNTTSSGRYSTAMGRNTNAWGDASTTMGYGTTASNVAATAMGYNTTASDMVSTAMGYLTTASGIQSTAMGSGTTASGYSSTAMGTGSIASGSNSTAMGAYTTAQSAESVAIGQYNIANGNTWWWVETDPVFVIGNGTSDAARSNAMTVLKNGKVKLHATTDANGTAGTGVLEIGDSLRVDPNEIITNTDTTLYLQRDNNGDLMVDADGPSSTFFVDASENRVGIGTSFPEQKLHVNGSSEILSTGPGAGFKFRSRNSGSSNTDFVWYATGAEGSEVAHLWNQGTGDIINVGQSGEVNMRGGTNPNNWSTHFNYSGDGRNYIRGSTIIADNGGDVGIGTSNPEGKLHVVNYNGWNGAIMGGSWSHGNLGIYAWGDEAGGRFKDGFGTSADIAHGFAIQGGGTMGGANFYDTDGAAMAYIAYGNYSLWGNGKVRATSWENASDIRLKDIHGTYTKGLNEIMQLNPIEFNYKADNPEKLDSKETHIGFSAQEVQSVIPEAVNTDDQGYLSLEKDVVFTTLINAVKELKVEKDSDVKRLQTQVTELKTQNSALKAAVCELKPEVALCK